MKKKMRCLKCAYYNYNFFDRVYEKGSFCGLHGRTKVDVNGFQVNLDKRGSCGFQLRHKPIQLYFDF